MPAKEAVARRIPTNGRSMRGDGQRRYAAANSGDVDTEGVAKIAEKRGDP